MWANNDPLVFHQVTEKLHERAGKNEPNKDDFIDLANRVEEFTLRFLDPLKHVKEYRENFSANPETDLILETAIKLEQKKVRNAFKKARAQFVNTRVTLFTG